MGKKILVIEDSKLQRKEILDLLLVNDLMADYAENGSTALRKIEYGDFSLILLDMVLPDISGIQLINKIKMMDKAKEFSIIVLSGLTDKENVVESLGMGVQDYITKPFHPKELINRINIHLQLQATHQKLREANLASSKFLSLLGHDLKSSFGNLYSVFELLDRTNKVDDGRQKLLSMAHKNARKANILLDDLILWGKALNDNIVQQNEHFDFSQLTKVVSSNFNELDGRKVEMNLSLNGAANVFADKNMIETALRNVISNARKFTPDGGVINICYEHISLDDKLYHAIIIEDNGVGIPGDMMRFLFSRHHINVRKDAEGNKGIGLGLLITSEFIYKNGGEIILTSKIGIGTTCKILLPSID